MAASEEESIYERILLKDRISSQCSGYNIKHPEPWKTSSDERIPQFISSGASAAAVCTSFDASGVPMTGRRSTDRRVSRKSKLRREDEATLDSTEEASRSSFSCSTSSNKEAYIRHKVLFC